MKKLAPLLFAAIIAMSAMGEVVWAGDKGKGACKNVNKDRVAAHIMNKFKGRLLRMKCQPNKSSSPLSVRVLTQDGKVKNIRIPKNQMMSFQ